MKFAFQMSSKFMAAVALTSLMTIVLGCASGNCRKNQEAKAETKAGATAEVPVVSKTTDRVRVYKPDGTLQCNKGKLIPLETMKKELKDLQIYSAENKADTMMRIQQCGTPTGKANVYEIDRKDLDAAKKLGFQLWTFE